MSNNYPRIEKNLEIYSSEHSDHLRVNISPDFDDVIEIHFVSGNEALDSVALGVNEVPLLISTLKEIEKNIRENTTGERNKGFRHG